ncbi:hypothetical protein [Vibrio sp. HN007]|uniref:hypothetical protein n=1 Tax=Vibrio iocasae TaxID=3098914 RepID=UPI0035D47D22
MLKQSLFIAGILLFSTTTFASEAMRGEKGKFIVGLGPIELGNVSIDSTCNDTTCFYRARAKGSFMFIGADVKENGSFKRQGHKVVPVSTDYEEKIGSKKKAYSYDFVEMEIKDKRSNEQKELPENTYTFMPLLNQVILDLMNGGPQDEYEYLSKHKHRKAVISGYTRKETENGLMHSFIGTQKDSEIEFYFLQKGENINLHKISYGSFHLSRIQ